MKLKILFFVLLIVISVFVNSLFTEAIHPVVSGELAIAQLENSHSNVVALRTYDRLANNVQLGIIVFLIGFGLLLFYPTSEGKEEK